jgi:hypothetical protein
LSQATNAGLTAILEAMWTSNSSPADVTSQTITVAPIVGGPNAVGPTSSGIYHATTGTYQFSWALPTSQAVGDYLVTWNATLGASAVQQQSVLTVNDANFGFASLLTWCDISLQLSLIQGGAVGTTGANVPPVDPVVWTKAVTGSALTLAQIQAGQQVLNMFSNYTPEASGFNMQPRDLILLRQSMAYQAAWMPGQPGLLQRTAVKQLSQDGLSTTLDDTNGTDQANLLAPLAQRGLKQLSWKKSRSLRVRTPFIDDQTPLSSDPDAEANDLYERWVDMYNFGYRGSSVP